jgi:hypothetical protein
MQEMLVWEILRGMMKCTSWPHIQESDIVGEVG